MLLLLVTLCQKLSEVRRASWSDVAPPPPPESDDEAVDAFQFCSVPQGPWALFQVIEFTKEDLFKEDAPTIEEQPQKSPEASGEARNTIVLVHKK